MMYPRLQLLKELLRDDGAIFVSIDDNEVQHLRMLMDEVFGSENFVTTAIWEKADSPRMDVEYFSVRHDYVVVFAKSLPNFSSALPMTTMIFLIITIRSTRKTGLII